MMKCPWDKNCSDDSCWKCWALLAGAGGFLLLLVIVIIGVVICCCVYRRRRTRRYRLLRNNQTPTTTFTREDRSRTSSHPHAASGTSQRTEEGLYEAMQRQREERDTSRRETALLNCQFYLRSNQRYALETHLPDIGSRMSKSWFMVRSISEGQFNPPFLLTMLPVGQQCRLSLHGSDKQVMNRLFRIIEHQSIHNIMEVDYIPDKRIVVILEPFLQRGSLKDLVYHTTPSLPWSTKYSVRRSGLRTHQIQNYGRQILEAVLFLHELGFNPFGQIQSGNIYIEGPRCKLSGIDNSLLAYKPRVFRNVKSYKENIDSVMFGHLIFELGSGRELPNPAPIESDYKNVRNTQVVEVLQFIFQSRIPPSINDILELPFFQNARTTTEHPEGIQLDEDLNALIYKSRKAKSKSGKAKKGSSSYSNEGYYPSSSFASMPRPSDATSSTVAASSVTNDSIPPPQPSNTNNDRSALWSDIHKGKRLRRTLTNDRSAPMLK